MESTHGTLSRVASLAMMALVGTSASASAEEGARPRAPVRRATAVYEVPDVTFRGLDGRAVSLKRELSREGPVLLNFIFTSCTTICSTMTATFAATQAKLAGAPVRLYSISIDPEHDTPERLKAYADRFHADVSKARWQFLTGTIEDTVALARAFDSYRGNKMSHAPVTFLRASPRDAWVRLGGFPSASELAAEYHQLVASLTSAEKVRR